MRRRRLALVASLCLALSAACSKNPEATRDDHLARGDALVAQHRLSDAVIEYRTAVQTDPKSVVARQKLAEAYVRTNDLGSAMGEYVRAADLAPNDALLHLRAGQFLLLAGRYEDAKTRAEQVLALQPTNVEALILKGNAFAGLKSFDRAMDEIETAIQADPSAGIGYSVMGILQMSKGKTAEAEKAFQKALAVSPKDLNAHLALANLYWASNRQKEAEQVIKSALTVDPRSVQVNRALVMILMGTGRKAEAEAPAKVVAESASGNAGWFALAEYYVTAGRLPDAKAVLQKLIADPASASRARLRLASVNLQAGDRAEAYRLVGEVLATEKTNVAALVGKANLQFSEGKLADASTTIRAALQADPASFSAHYQHGVILAAENKDDEAVGAFKAAIQSNPAFAPADVELARLSLRAGRPAEAVQYAQAAVDAMPGYANGQLLLARAHLANRNTKAAEMPLRVLAANFPRLPVVQVEVGRLLAATGDEAHARAAFQAALATDPAMYGAIEGLAILDVKQKRPDAARARVEAAIKAAPNQAALQILAARTYATTGDNAAAEAALKRALSIDPNDLVAYQLLGGLYMQQSKLPQATEEFRRIAERQPRSTFAHTAVGLMLQLQNKLPEAIASYEKAIAINPNAAIAANNLAQIYADRNERLDVALQLAQTAKAALPRSHEVDDTLGWVYLKKKLPAQAIMSFKQSLTAEPDNPLYLYHLGLAYLETGERSLARQTLEKALKLKPDFDGADDARRVLQSLRG